MNASELAAAMLKWQELQTAADELAAEIAAAVLDIGKTQTVGNVRASFSNGRKSYDYEAAARAQIPADELDRLLPDFTKTTVSVDWSGLCKANYASADDFIKSQSEPSVSLKIID